MNHASCVTRRADRGCWKESLPLHNLSDLQGKALRQKQQLKELLLQLVFSPSSYLEAPVPGLIILAQHYAYAPFIRLGNSTALPVDVMRIRKVFPVALWIPACPACV